MGNLLLRIFSNMLSVKQKQKSRYFTRTLSRGADIKSGNLKKAMKESGRIPRGPTHPPLPSQYQRKLKKGICFKWFENVVVIHTENIKNLAA